LRPIYDVSLRLSAQNGFGFIGMLLTTPQWARDPSCRPQREEGIPRIVLIEGTTRAARGWLDSAPIGRPDAQLWITELGWCTTPGNCPGTLPVSAVTIVL
jgi:hypothetical protein